MKQTTDSELQHLAVLQQALAIYVDRTGVRGELWAAFDVHDALHNCRSKLYRAIAAVKTSEHMEQAAVDETLDSLYDLINYAAFAIRHVTGEKPEVEPVEL